MKRLQEGDLCPAHPWPMIQARHQDRIGSTSESRDPEAHFWVKPGRWQVWLSFPSQINEIVARNITFCVFLYQSGRNLISDNSVKFYSVWGFISTSLCCFVLFYLGVPRPGGKRCLFSIITCLTHPLRCPWVSAHTNGCSSGLCPRPVCSPCPGVSTTFYCFPCFVWHVKLSLTTPLTTYSPAV